MHARIQVREYIVRAPPLPEIDCWLTFVSSLPAPAQDVIKYETRVFDENFQAKGPYMGRPDGVPDAGIPTNETDAMWDDLYLSKSIFQIIPCLFFPFLHARLSNHASLIVGVSQIPYSSARQLPNATELIPGTEDQYIVELDVFHQLHCLNALRKSFYPERYWDSFIDYWIDDGSPRGRGPRNYTSIDAKHFGKSGVSFPVFYSVDSLFPHCLWLTFSFLFFFHPPALFFVLHPD